MKFSNISAIIVLLGLADQQHVVTQAVQLGEVEASNQFTQLLRHHNKHRKHHEEPEEAAAATDAPAAEKSLDAKKPEAPV
jgi:hypothetical protein